MKHQGLVKRCRKNRSIIMVMFICITLSTIVILPNHSFAFNSATAEFVDSDFPSGNNLIELNTFEQNVTSGLSGGQSTGGGGSAARSELSSAFMEADLNRTVPIALRKAAGGEPIREVKITFDGGNRSIRLLNVVFYFVGWSDILDRPSAVKFALDFAQIYWTVGDVTTGWDLERNVPIIIP